MTRNRPFVLLTIVMLTFAVVAGPGVSAQQGKQRAGRAGKTAKAGQANKKGSSRNKTTRKGVKPGNTKAIDVRVQRFQDSFLRQASALARSYEEAGDLVKTRKMLRLLLRINPDMKGVREKIKQLDETMLSANGFSTEIDVSKGWGQPVAAVAKGRAFRILATGDYRFVVSLPVGPAGFSIADTARDMADGIRCGAVIGVIVPAPEPGKTAKPGKPFLVGAGGQISPSDNGLLFLKVNAPAGHKCNGRLRIQFSGNIRKP